MNKGAPRLMTLLGVLAWLSACASLRPPPRASATLVDHAPVVAQDLPAGGAWPGARWWTAYDDPVLTSLVEVAIGNGRDIASADARLRQAQDEVRVAAAGMGLQIGVSGGYTRFRREDAADVVARDLQLPRRLRTYDDAAKEGKRE